MKKVIQVTHIRHNQDLNLIRIALNQVTMLHTALVYAINKLLHEDKNMGCCGSCGGEAPTDHTNDQDENKETNKEATSQPQEQDAEKK